MAFWNAFQIHTGGNGPSAPTPVRHEPPIEGNGYVPMFRATCEAVQQRQTDLAQHPLSSTITTLALVDDLRRTLMHRHHFGDRAHRRSTPTDHDESDRTYWHRFGRSPGSMITDDLDRQPYVSIVSTSREPAFPSAGAMIECSVRVPPVDRLLGPTGRHSLVAYRSTGPTRK